MDHSSSEDIILTVKRQNSTIFSCMLKIKTQSTLFSSDIISMQKHLYNVRTFLPLYLDLKAFFPWSIRYISLQNKARALKIKFITVLDTSPNDKEQKT
jgi:hypothetical protein